ncbi:MAG: tetratricopeptide repeat protein [Thermoguttaceae bacterium]
MTPSSKNGGNGCGNGDSGRPRNMRRVPRIRFMLFTLLIACLAILALYFVRTYQVVRMARSVRDRAEALASERHYQDAGAYFLRYLQLRPDDATARIRLAEVYDLSAANPQRAVELYQAALGAADNSATIETKLRIRRRLVELLLKGGQHQTAENEAKNLAQWERQPASQLAPEQWHGPGLQALAVFGQFRAKNAAVAPSAVERAFQPVLDPRSGEPHVYQDPRVYLARWRYRVQQRLPGAEDDLRAALRLGPEDFDVLLAAAVDAQERMALAKSDPAKMKGLFDAAVGYYQRAIASAPSDAKGYLGLGQLYVGRGDLRHAIETWRTGLKGAGQRDTVLHLLLADAMIQENRLDEAETTLRSLETLCTTLRSQAKFSLRPLIDLRRGQIALRNGDYQNAIDLVAKLAGDKEAASQTELGQRGIYQAWLVLGAANAALQRWDPSLAAYEQATAMASRDLTPRMAAAAVCVRAGKYSAGIRCCQQALTVANALNPPRIWDRQVIYQQLISLLEHESRTEEARRYRELRMTDIANSAELTARWVEEAVWNGKPDEAVTVAQSGVSARPHDPAAHLMLGSAWWAKGEMERAKAAFDAAARAAPDDPRPLDVLFQFYAETHNGRDGRRTLDRIASSRKWSEFERATLLANGYAKLGDVRAAREACKKAVVAAGDDAAKQLRVAESLVRLGDRESARIAERVLRGLAASYPPARQRLAAILLSRGTVQAWDEGRRLLEAPSDGQASEENRLSLALGWMRRGGAESLAQADALCRQLLAGGVKSAVVVELLLAEIEHLRGNTDKARERYRAIADRTPPAAENMVVYVGLLVEHGPADEARNRLAQLEKLAPDNVAVLLLRARWLHGQGQDSRIEPTVEQWAARVLPKSGLRPRIQLAERIGDVYRRVGKYGGGERWYRRVVGLAPGRFEPLALVVAEQGRLDEAIKLCEPAVRNGESLGAAICMCRILMTAKPNAEIQRRCEPSLAIALTTWPESVDLLTSVAGVYILQGKSEEAIQMCREILRREPEHFAALNNLAALLSECPEPERRREARQCVDRAIALFGPRPELLDTQGMVLLTEEKLGQAVAVFHEAVSAPVADPRCYFHLAVAYSRLGELDRARDALAQARRTRLERHVLTQLDRSRLAELESRLR